MSNKIFKSSRLIVSEPRVIDIKQQFVEENNDPILSEAEIDPQSVNEEIVATEDYHPELSIQADQILKETEQMVKELLATARTEAEKIITEAREQSEQNLLETNQKVQKIQQDAYDQGYQNGFSEGKVKVEKDHQALLDEAKIIVDEAYLEKEKIVKSSEDELVKLASAIAQKIVQRELSTEPSIIIDIVQEALKKVNDREELNLLVNPSNLDTLINVQEELVNSTKGVKKMKIIADPTISAGGALIETANGTVDARVERQLEEIEESLMEVTDGD